MKVKLGSLYKIKGPPMQTVAYSITTTTSNSVVVSGRHNSGVSNSIQLPVHAGSDDGGVFVDVYEPLDKNETLEQRFDRALLSVRPMLYHESIWLQNGTVGLVLYLNIFGGGNVCGLLVGDKVYAVHTGHMEKLK